MDQTKEKRYSIGMRKSRSQPHLITLYRKDWQNNDAWGKLVKELDLKENTDQIGLLISKNSLM